MNPSRRDFLAGAADAAMATPLSNISV